jgi:REP element-mobilizing transposase RayT
LAQSILLRGQSGMRMPRPPRIHIEGGFYHTTLRGNHRENIFQFESDRLLLNTIVELALAKHRAQMHAYCWMTNHLHMIVQVGSDPLSKLIHRIASGYARAYQANRKTTGHLFENRFHAVLVDTDAYLLELIRYVHMNPVRAGLAPKVQLYRWSSHHAYSGLNVDRWVTTEFGLRMFAEDRSKAVTAYRRFVTCDANAVTSPLDEIQPDTPQILGTEEFIARLKERRPESQLPKTLDSVITEGCGRHGLHREDIQGHRRDHRVAAARAWIAREAMALCVATVSQLARAIDCDPKTIRNALRQPPDEG